jgi:hypothetical protein
LDFDENAMVRRLYGVSGGRVGVVLRLLKAVPLLPGSGLALRDLQSAAKLVFQDAARSDLYFAEQEPTDRQLAGAYTSVMKDANLPVEVLTHADAGAHLDQS